MENNGLMYLNECPDTLSQRILDEVSREMNRHIGHDMVICADKVMEKLGYEMSNSMARKYIHTVVKTDMLPLASCRKGFYYAVSDAEIAEYNRNINQRMEEMEAQRQAVNRAYRVRKGIESW